MTRRVLALVVAAGHVAGWWQLNRKLDEHHAARMAQAGQTHRAVVDALRDQDQRADKLLADIKATPRRRRT